MNRVGSARDVILIGVILFSVATVLFVIYFAAGQAINGIVSIPVVNQSAETVEVFESTLAVTSNFDYVGFALFIGLCLALIITGWFIGGEPIFMFVYFIFVVFAVVIGAILANVWEDFTGQAVFGLNIVAFPILDHILLNLPIYLSIVGFIGIMSMFAKPYLGGGG